MSQIKTPIEIQNINSCFLLWQKGEMNNETFTFHLGINLLRLETKFEDNEFIDKQTAIDFCQSMLKDFCTIEVTKEDFDKYLLTIKQP